MSRKSGKSGLFLGSLRTPGTSHFVGMVVMALALISVISYWAIIRFSIREVVLHSGQEVGTYQPLAVEIARLIERENSHLKVRVTNSAGSYENLERVADQEESHSIGIIQNDVRIPRVSRLTT